MYTIARNAQFGNRNAPLGAENVPLGARNQTKVEFLVCAPKTPMWKEVEGRPIPMLSEIFKMLET